MVKNLKISFLFVFTLWVVFVVDLILPMDFNKFGIVPRTPFGLIGIVTSPFLHANLTHLISNTVPLFVLTLILLAFYKRESLSVIIIVVLLGGILVWIFGRSSYHIGASGLIYGVVAFLISCGIFRRNLRAIILSIIVLLLYGGIIYGIFPTKTSISWEGHLFGALSGVFCGYIFRKRENVNQKNKTIQ